MEWSLSDKRKKPGLMGSKIFISIVSIYTLLIISCHTNGDVADRRHKRQFYYYPVRNVYYDPLNGTYFYSINGGKSWSSYTAVTDPQNYGLGRKVDVTSDKLEIYQDNLRHRQLYAGKLFELPDSSLPVEVAGPEVVERKVVVKKHKTTAEKNKADSADSKRTGIGKLIRKIFGKQK